MKIAVIGHFTYFSNHFIEGWQEDSQLLCLDVNENNYNWLLCVRNFQPEITLFFRPELYPRKLVESIPGVRVALLSEPIPNIEDGEFENTAETNLRLEVYKNMSWNSFHWRIYYDVGKIESAKHLGFPIDEFRPLPIDTSIFNPYDKNPKSLPVYDICFVGKPTEHRISKLDFLRSSHFSFIWVAHGISGAELASLFQRSKIILNVHADAKKAMEPRIYLGAACGGLVVSEPMSSSPLYFRDRIIVKETPWNEQLFLGLLDIANQGYEKFDIEQELAALSTRNLVRGLCEWFGL